MKWIIVTDSGCDMRTQDTAGAVGYIQAPMQLLIGEKNFVDTADIDIKALLDAMRAHKGASSSTCPSPGMWKEAFTQGDLVIALTISSAMSGSMNSAEVAKKMVLEESPDKKIFILDTLNAGSAMTLLAQKAAELIMSGLDFEHVCQKLAAYKEKTKLIFNLKSLDNLAKNGRVSKAIAAIAGVLNIGIVGLASEKGTFELAHKCRGAQKAYRLIVEEMKRIGCRGGRAVISHCQNMEGAQQLKRMIEEAFAGIKVQLMQTGGLCSYYAEEGGLMIGFETV